MTTVSESSSMAINYMYTMCNTNTYKESSFRFLGLVQDFD